MKQRMAPHQSRRENPPNNCLQNFTHSGVVLGGVNSLRPSRSSTSFAFSTVKPCTTEHRTTIKLRIPYILNYKCVFCRPMHVCLSVCMYICLYVYVCVCMCAWGYVCMDICIRMYVIHVCMYVRMVVCTCM